MTSLEAHRRRRFRGRDPSEGHRTATPLVALAPVFTVVGHETLGHRHMADALGQL